MTSLARSQAHLNSSYSTSIEIRRQFGGIHYLFIQNSSSSVNEGFSTSLTVTAVTDSVEKDTWTQTKSRRSKVSRMTSQGPSCLLGPCWGKFGGRAATQTFRLQKGDKNSPGDVTWKVVDVRGRRIRGAIYGGDEIEARGRVDENGIVRASYVRNKTTGAMVHGYHLPPHGTGKAPLAKRFCGALTHRRRTTRPLFSWRSRGIS